MPIRIWLAVLMALALAACSARASIEMATTPAERAFAEHAIATVRAGRYEALPHITTPELWAHLTPQSVGTMRGLIPAGGLRLEGAATKQHHVNGAPATFKTLDYSVGGGDRWAVVEVTLSVRRKDVRMAGIYVVPFDRSPAEINAFTLRGKGVLHYLWLVAMAGAAAASIAAFVLVVRARRSLGWKAAWGIGSLVSFGAFSLNWTTGRWIFTPVHLLLLGASGAEQGGLAPWMLRFGIPVVALIVLARAALGRLEPRRAREPV